MPKPRGYFNGFDGGFIDITGHVYNGIKVIGLSSKTRTSPSRPEYKLRLWNCLCHCGREFICSSGCLRSGNTKSCGCGRVKKNAVFLHIVKSYKQSAKRRNLEFSLSEEQFKTLIKSACIYCGEEPNHTCYYIPKYGNAFQYNGIDRVDNNQGYIIENCVSCCKTCNIAKNKLTVDQFYDWIKRVYTRKFIQ